ncbi:MAG: hypothetical protein JXR71_03340 [Bacteroidales bacterium]|nr:hypothetical protein [Bacteroidales bacterium]
MSTMIGTMKRSGFGLRLFPLRKKMMRERVRPTLEPLWTIVLVSGLLFFFS